jgi:peptide deformylase
MDISRHITDGKLTIHYFGNPVLTTVCTPFADDELGSALENLGILMLGTIDGTLPTNNEIQPGLGMGLAANQVGVTRRLIVLKCKSGEDIIAVNPVVVGYGPVVAHEEGCLSLPSIYEQVRRHNQAILSYQEPSTGSQQRRQLEGYDAFCALHEQDHLNGIEFIDRRVMDKNLSKGALRRWEKIKHNYL